MASVVIYPSRSVEQEQLVIISEFLTSGRITRIYLDELSDTEPLPIGLELMLLTTLPDDRAVATAKTLTLAVPAAPRQPCNNRDDINYYGLQIYHPN